MWIFSTKKIGHVQLLGSPSTGPQVQSTIFEEDCSGVFGNKHQAHHEDTNMERIAQGRF